MKENGGKGRREDDDSPTSFSAKPLPPLPTFLHTCLVRMMRGRERSGCTIAILARVFLNK